MVLDVGVDWDEVAELLTESYCVLAPKKLVELVDRGTAVALGETGATVCLIDSRRV